MSQWPVIAVLTIGCLSSEASAQEPTSPKAARKTLNLDMQSKPWKAVCEWLSEQTGVPVVADRVPTGTFSVVSPRTKTYSLSEVIDLLNEALMGQKYLLVRGDQCLRLVPADAATDATLLPGVSREELGNRGQTDKNADDLKALMEARLKLAQEVLKLSQERLKLDVNARWQDVVDASLRVLNADLGLSPDKAARIAAHERHVKVAEDLAHFSDADVRNKTMSELERRLVRYLLIDAKIGLEREKARK
jgi:hypothetical protein